MDNDRYLWLVTRQLAGEITPEEKAELDEILRTSTYDRARYSLIEKFWRQEVFYSQSQDVDAALQRTLNKINSGDEEKEQEEAKVIEVSWWRTLAVAASIVFVLAAGFAGYRELATEEPEVVTRVERHNGHGMRSMVTLSDGTRVWLNADSRISYPNKFIGDQREVRLEGEAFFNVAHNPEKPFFIQLDHAVVRVLGTSFNVKAYQDEPEIQTSVLTGKVAFMPKTTISKPHRDTVLLTRDNRVTFSIKSGELLTEVVDARDDKEWINGKLVFRSETLQSIAKNLERSFGKKVIIRNEKIGQHRFTATFEDSNLNDILYYLSLTNKFKYEISDSTISIY